MISSIKSLLPKPIYEFLRERRRERLECRYFKQGCTRIKYGAYEIEVPKDHLLISLIKSQPYRDLNIGITAKHISHKYPNRTIVDIGANIGDTASIIATYAQNKLVLVEASDYFFDILVRNASLLPNETVVKKALILDGSKVRGSFHHWGGTAFFHEEKSGKTEIKTERLSDVADDKTCLIKTDVDGHDFKVLIDSLEWLASVSPAIIFENQIRHSQDLNNANELFARLIQIGYTYFIVWDDAGFHLVSTTALNVLTDLNRYLFKIWQSDRYKSINNYDVLCLHHKDEDVYKGIYEWCKTY